MRYELFTAAGAPFSPPSVVVKQVELGQATSLSVVSAVSHQRKLRSYQVEAAFYTSFAALTDAACRVPRGLHFSESETGFLFVLEDLNASGFADLPGRVDRRLIRECLAWLAHFHACFVGAAGDQLWPVGTYWHLGTRPEEFERMRDRKLKDAAHAIDERLSRARFQTLVHGDAKADNFCVRGAQKVRSGGQVAAVDFQYVGRGVGVKDVAYFLSSVLSERECERQEKELLDEYFRCLRRALTLRNFAHGAELEDEWRLLYPFAWADFVRFLSGWSPGQVEVHGYSRRLTDEVLARLS